MKFGERLRKAREHARLSQKELEARSGVSQKTISKIERGDQDGSTQLVQLARACNVSTDWLATETGPMVPGQGVEQPDATYQPASEEALEIARAFDQLQPQAREFILEQVFVYTVIDKSFPWLRHGKPMGKSYDEFEKWHQRNIELARDVEAQRAGAKPRELKRAKERSAG